MKILFLHGIGDGNVKEAWFTALCDSLDALGYPRPDKGDVIAPQYAPLLNIEPPPACPLRMKSSQVIPRAAAEHFWFVVRGCIREFHAKRSAPALGKATRLRKKVERLAAEEMEVFYHGEPFEVACRLAGRSFGVEDHLERYLKIRDSKGDEHCRFGGGAVRTSRSFAH